MIDSAESGEPQDPPRTFRDVELVDGPLDGLILSCPSTSDAVRIPAHWSPKETGGLLLPVPQKLFQKNPSAFLVYEDSGKIKRTSPVTHLALFNYSP